MVMKRERVTLKNFKNITKRQWNMDTQEHTDKYLGCCFSHIKDRDFSCEGKAVVIHVMLEGNSPMTFPDFRAEHRIGVLGRDCSLQEPQQARHLCRHFAYSTAGVLQLPERP